MKRFLGFLLKALISFVLITVFVVLAIVCFPRGTYEDSYPYVLQRKYDYFKSCDEPKIVIIGGSSAGFGIDEAYIEQETGYKVTNLGLHAGFGEIVPSELSKANINEGDIVLLAYEWGWEKEEHFTDIGTDLVMLGFGYRFDMYARLPARFYPKILGYLPEYAAKKVGYMSASGTYSIYSFDELGRMTLDRPNVIMQYEGNEDIYNYIEVTEDIAPDSVEYLTAYKEFVEKRNASVYFVSCPTYENSIRTETDVFRKLAENEEKQIGIPYISDPEDYFFPEDMMFDTIYHCNNDGQRYRSELIVQDLRNAGVID